jgi:hypothetical protein
MSTIALQSSFDPARDRLMSLHCSKKLKFTPTRKTNVDEL